MLRRQFIGTSALVIALPAGSRWTVAQSAADQAQAQFDPRTLYSRALPAIVAGRSEVSADEIVEIANRDMFEGRQEAATRAFWRGLNAAVNAPDGAERVANAASQTLTTPAGVEAMVALFRSPSTQAARGPAQRLLRAETAAYAIHLLAPVAINLLNLGASRSQIAGLFGAEFGGAVQLGISDAYQLGQIANVTARKSANGTIDLRIEPAAAGGGGGEPVPGPSTQGFFQSLGRLLSAIGNFYLDMLWNMFMGAAAGAALGMLTGNPLGGAIGAAAGAGLGGWYTMGKYAVGAIGGVWLGPDPQNPDSICESPPFILC
ncbi:MAG: hypothetical protein RLO50_09275 [Azospirillaceae bacterium]